MIYADLPVGATVFVDASPFIHHFEPNPAFGPASTRLLERIENQETSGVTTTHVISEVAHRLMTIEAMQTVRLEAIGHSLAASQPSGRGEDLETAAAITQQVGLLHNDPLIIAAMQAHSAPPSVNVTTKHQAPLPVLRERGWGEG